MLWNLKPVTITHLHNIEINLTEYNKNKTTRWFICCKEKHRCR